jgi:predicted phage terminase large subunit-like protein
MNPIDPAKDTTSSLDEPRTDLRTLSDEQLAMLVAEKAPVLGSRQFFAHFRKYVDPKLIENWWTLEISTHLQQFYDDIIAGKRPKLAIMTPPQHGKSRAAEDFTAWIVGKMICGDVDGKPGPNPNLKVIFASYSDDLGTRTNRNLQRLFRKPEYRRVFPFVITGLRGWIENSELIEFYDTQASFRNTTVNGSITGHALDLGIIDDPIRGRNDANSKPIRDKTWSWFTDDFLLRFSANAAFLFIGTRWHVDDPLGRAIEKFSDKLKVLRYPAIAEINLDGTKNWIDQRQSGEALFPEFKPLEFLREQRGVLTDASWEALYQQSPYIVGGGLIPIEKIKAVLMWDRTGIKRTVRYIDKAGSENSGAYTAMVLMHRMYDGRFVISHVVRGQWSALDRERMIRTYVAADRKLYPHSYKVVIEQEPGSGGKESAESTIRNLAGTNVFADKVTGSKEVRAEPFIAQCQGGNVWFVAGGWIHDFLAEAESWPNGRYRDQIDAAAGSFAWLIKEPTYTLEPFQPGFVDYDRRPCWNGSISRQ